MPGYRAAMAFPTTLALVALLNPLVGPFSAHSPGEDLTDVYPATRKWSQQGLSTVCSADDVWRLPLWAGYEKGLDSKVADCKNVANGPYGGAIVAALYLQRYIQKVTSSDHDDKSDPPSWIHIDVMAYNQASTPGRPEGGEAMGMRALYALLAERYAKP